MNCEITIDGTAQRINSENDLRSIAFPLREITPHTRDRRSVKLDQDHLLFMKTCIAIAAVR